MTEITPEQIAELRLRIERNRPYSVVPLSSEFLDAYEIVVRERDLFRQKTIELSKERDSGPMLIRARRERDEQRQRADATEADNAALVVAFENVVRKIYVVPHGEGLDICWLCLADWPTHRETMGRPCRAVILAQPHPGSALLAENQQLKTDVAEAIGWDKPEPWSEALAQIRRGEQSISELDELREAITDNAALADGWNGYMAWLRGPTSWHAARSAESAIERMENILAQPHPGTALLAELTELRDERAQEVTP